MMYSKLGILFSILDIGNIIFPLYCLNPIEYQCVAIRTPNPGVFYGNPVMEYGRIFVTLLHQHHEYQ